MSTPRSLPPSHAWLRTFVLLLALCVPAAPTALPVSPVAPAAEIVEYDVVDTVSRPVTARRTHRPAAVPRPAPHHPRATPAVSPAHPHTPPARRSVVLRC